MCVCPESFLPQQCYVVLIFIFQMLCSKGANILQTKSLCVQEAANELIEMLCEVQDEDEMAEDDHRDHGKFLGI